jgi:hypothetical protein
MTAPDKGKMTNMKEYSKYSGLVFQMFLIVAAGLFVGRELDRIFSSHGRVFTITLTVCSAFLAIYHLFRTLIKK